MIAILTMLSLLMSIQTFPMIIASFALITFEFLQAIIFLLSRDPDRIMPWGKHPSWHGVTYNKDCVKVVR